MDAMNRIRTDGGKTQPITAVVGLGEKLAPENIQKRIRVLIVDVKGDAAKGEQAMKKKIVEAFGKENFSFAPFSLAGKEKLGELRSLLDGFDAAIFVFRKGFAHEKIDAIRERINPEGNSVSGVRILALLEEEPSAGFLDLKLNFFSMGSHEYTNVDGLTKSAADLLKFFCQAPKQ